MSEMLKRFWISFALLFITCYCKRKVSEIIPEDYNPDIPPVVNNSAVPVYFSCLVLGIDNIKEATMDFRLIGVILVIWKDPRLNLKRIASNHSMKFPSSEYSNIWQPEFAYPFTKNIEKFEDKIGFSKIKVLKDESLIGIARFNYIVDCPMDLRDYPMDIQKCSFHIGSASHSDDEVAMKWIEECKTCKKHKGIDIRHMNLLKYEMSNVETDKIVLGGFDGNYTVLVAQFTFIRRLTGNIMNVYIPSTLVVMLSWLSFWIDVTAVPARITLGVTSILTLVTHLVQSRSFVPPVDYLKALDIWFIFCIILIFLSILEYAMAYQFVRSKKEKSHSGTKTSQKQRFHSDPKEENVQETMKIWISYMRDKTYTLFQPSDVNLYDRISRYLFPFVYINFATFYWIYYLYNRHD